MGTKNKVITIRTEITGEGSVLVLENGNRVSLADAAQILTTKVLCNESVQIVNQYGDIFKFVKFSEYCDGRVKYYYFRDQYGYCKAVVLAYSKAFTEGSSLAKDFQELIEKVAFRETEAPKFKKRYPPRPE